MDRTLVVYPFSDPGAKLAFAQQIAEMFTGTSREGRTIEVCSSRDVESKIAEGGVRRVICPSLQRLSGIAFKVKKSDPTITAIILAGSTGAGEPDREESHGVVVLRHHGQGIAHLERDLFDL